LEDSTMEENELGNNEHERVILFWWNVFVKAERILRRYALRLTKNTNLDADDLTHQTICKVVELSPDPERIKNPVAYLTTCLRNTFLSIIKKNPQQMMVSLDDEKNIPLMNKILTIDPVALRNLENEELNEELKKTLEIAMRNLKPEEYDIFSSFLEYGDCDQVADVLNKDIFRVKYVLNSVRSKVRYRLLKAKTAKS
jgi:RNA polymerase sigma factor (sigma-70 family)